MFFRCAKEQRSRLANERKIEREKERERDGEISRTVSRGAGRKMTEKIRRASRFDESVNDFDRDPALFTASGRANYARMHRPFILRRIIHPVPIGPLLIES